MFEYSLSFLFLGWKVILEEPQESKVCSPHFIRIHLVPHSSAVLLLIIQQIHKVRVKSYGENFQWEGDDDMEGTVRLRTTHK
jgi:hypothetical protein